MMRDRQQAKVLCRCRSCGGEMYAGSVGVDFGDGVTCEECCQNLTAFQLALLSGAEYVEVRDIWNETA